MKTLGIDYGTKRVGIAVSDDTGTLAFPKMVLANDADLLTQIKKFIESEQVTSCVLGESRSFSGGKNPVGEAVAEFKKKLEEATDLPVYYQEEFLSSVEARKIDSSPETRDAHAAVVILQRYLDKEKHGKRTD